MTQDSGDDEGSTDPEGPDPSEMDPDDEPEVMPCPYCGKSIHEQAEWCHHCGKYLSAEDRSPQVPGWIMAGTVAGILGILAWVIVWLVG